MGCEVGSHFFPLLSFPSKENDALKYRKGLKNEHLLESSFIGRTQGQLFGFQKGTQKYVRYLGLIISTSLPNFYFFIFLFFYKTKFHNFNFHFSKFQQLKNKNEKCTLSCVFVIVTP
jgi:hypothetical protein